MLPHIHFSSTLSISTYFLVISLACTIGAMWFVKRAERHQFQRVVAIDLTLLVMVSGFLGARLLHVFYEEPFFYSEKPWRILQVWNGGFVFLGGVLTALAAAWVYCRVRREPFWYWADLATVPIAFGYGLGRLACFLNGCCYGKVCELPWAVYLQGGYRHPTQLYASLWEFSVMGLLLAIESRMKTSGLVFNLWLVLHGAGRILMEVFRGDPRGDMIQGLSLGIWISIGLIVWGLGNITILRLHRGMVS